MNYIQKAIERGNLDDLKVSICMFCVAKDAVDELDKEPRPIKWGRSQYFKQYLISPEAIEKIYQEPDMPWLYGYAAYMEEFREKFKAAEIQPFKPKH